MVQLLRRGYGGGYRTGWEPLGFTVYDLSSRLGAPRVLRIAVYGLSSKLEAPIVDLLVHIPLPDKEAVIEQVMSLIFPMGCAFPPGPKEIQRTM